MLIAFIVVFAAVCIVAFCLGFKNGRNRSKMLWEDEIQYVTIGEIEQMAEDMRANGATDDDIMVLIQSDWLENEK